MRLFLMLLTSFFMLTSFEPVSPTNDDVGMIHWMTWEEALEAQKMTPRKIFVDVYTDWCGYCKKMDKTTFQDAKVIRALSKDFYAIKFNAERKDTINYNGADFTFVNSGRRGAHQLAYALLDGRMGYPSFVYLDEDVKRILPSPGYKKPNELMQELDYISTDAYKEMSLNDFIKRAD